MATSCELAQRTTIRAFRSGPTVLIVAEGEQPSPGYDAKSMLRPEDIFPPWYEVLRCSRPGFFAHIIVPYRVSLTIEYPEDQETVTVFHADGEDKVTIEACGEQLSVYSALVGVALLADPEVVAPGGSLEVTVDNGGDQTVTYGLVYTIERWDGKTWQKTDIAPTIFPEILLVTPPGMGRPQPIMLPDDIEAGLFRVAKSVAEQETDTILELYVQFEVR